MKTIILFSLFFLSTIVVAQQHNNRKSGAETTYGLDTTCRVFEGNFSSIAKRLESRLQAVKLNDSLLFSLIDPATINVSYFHYSRPSNDYFLIKISVDSSGKFRSYDIYPKGVDKGRHKKRTAKTLAALQSYDYKSIISKRVFLRTTCYVSDGADIFVIVNDKSEVLNGLGIVPLGNYDQLGSDYSSFLKIIRPLK